MRSSSRRGLALPLLLTATLGLVACGANQGATSELVEGVPSGMCSDQAEFDDQFALSRPDRLNSRRAHSA